MQDQDIPVGEGFELDCETQVLVPSMIVIWLREAAYAEIGLAAEALDMVAFDRDREAHQEWFRGPAENLKQICVSSVCLPGSMRPAHLQVRSRRAAGGPPGLLREPGTRQAAIKAPF
jgi:hypothetical protein